MFVVMHCGGIQFNGDTIKTKSLGGSETAAYYVARELAKAGHRVTIFTNSEEVGMFDGVKYEWAGNLSNGAPLGDRFTYYAENTPHDVCIIQRHPRAFERKYASKINMWWLHDIALHRSRDIVLGQMWNVDRVLVVSEYHKKQVSKVYGIPETTIDVVRNGIDLDLYDQEPLALSQDTKHIFYSSRPERGLINLVGADGIMEQLKDSPVILHVCGYDNTTPEMAPLYNALWERCEQLPNVVNHGSLTKSELAKLQLACDAWVYPTEFEEVSCITAMEAMAAGCEIITCDVGALEETCTGTSGNIYKLEDGKANVSKFVNQIRNNVWFEKSARSRQREVAKRFDWKNVADEIISSAELTFGQSMYTSLAHHFIRHSDIKPFEVLNLKDMSALSNELVNEYNQGYAFYRDNTYGEHYKNYYAYESARGVVYGPEDVTRTSRFQVVASHVAQLPARSRVLDYGCAHGHYTVALARMFPGLNFVGADLTQSNIDSANDWAKQEGLINIKFQKVGGFDDLVTMNYLGFDLIIAAEVIEHVGNPQEYIDGLANILEENGKMIITTPYGPWEAQGYREHGFWRAHLHHFEREDLQEMIGHHPNYSIVAAPSGLSKFHSALGSYITTFTKPTEPSKEINYRRKINQTMPDQTVTCCMIVKDAENDITRCLKSVIPFVQEIVIGVDKTTKDKTADVIVQMEIDNPLVAFNVFEIESPTVQGFASARNKTISVADGDWVFWIDSDEVLVNGEVIARYLRNSMYNGFAMKQHHFSQDPIGIIKTDLPCRLFRNHKDIKFFGAVHEHPEIKLNEGLGPVSIMPNASIIHYGYTSENVRRKRFDRNLPLLKRDREELPERLLGKFLWLRDLAQSCQYDTEDGRMDQAVFDQRIEEGIKLWHELLESENYRIILDGLPYYSQLVLMKGDGVDVSFTVDASLMNETDSTKTAQVKGYFENIEVAQTLIEGLLKEKVGAIDRRYL